jgi:molybdate transport system ATP-binding protein
MMIEINVRKKLGGVDLEFNGAIRDGEFAAIFGASGAGKTTLLRMIAGLATPDSGRIVADKEVWFDNARGVNLPPQKRKTGFVFQDYALFPNMTALQNVAFALKRRDKNEAARLLELCQLTALANRRVSELSGGQKQRVALARALAAKPKILLLDEPLSALDVALRLELQSELLAIQRERQIAALLVSHDISEVFKLSTRAFVLERGKVARDGAPAEVFASGGVSNKFKIAGEVLAIEQSGVVVILTLLAGGDIIKVAASRAEASDLKVGDHAMIASKAFNPIVMKMN